MKKVIKVWIGLATSADGEAVRLLPDPKQELTEEQAETELANKLMLAEINRGYAYTSDVGENGEDEATEVHLDVSFEMMEVEL